MRNFRRWTLISATGLLVLLGACGDGGTDPTPSEPPEITVTGVQDGAVFEEPVTIVVGVEQGATFQATLDGASFFSGTTVSEAGSHVLEVTARKSGLTSSVTIRFEIRPVGGDLLIVRFFDLGDNDAGGGGDAILLSDSSSLGQDHVLIDAGPAGEGGSDRDFVLTRLELLGVDRLEAMILSHAHTDHFDGMAAILNGIPVGAFYYNGQERDFSRYEQLVSLAGTRAESRIAVDELVDLPFGASEVTSLRVLPPLGDHLDDLDASSSDINDESLGTALFRGDFHMFFTGDGEVDANRRWRTTFGDLTGGIDVLKVGHHGGNDAVFDNGSSGSSSWLDHTDPDVQIISSNGTSHPRVRALQLLQGRSGSTTYCTNVHGDIELRVDEEGDFSVTVQRNAGMDCEPGEDAST